MKILITGSAGLLGTELCDQLSTNNEVWAVDNLSRGVHFPNNVRSVQLNISKIENLNTLPTDFDYIYHYGAVNGTSNFYERPNFVLVNNFTCDVNMFEFAKTCKNLKNLAYASSSEIVSDEPCSLTELIDITINNIHNARWSYRLGKICSENYLTNSELPWTIFRYFNVYGKNSKQGHFLADQVNKIHKGIFELIGANETRSFCHVRDAMEATIYCTENAHKQIINIGNDRELTILDAANIIANAMGHQNPAWNIKPSLHGSAINRRPNITKLRELMPHYAPTNFEDALKEIVNDIHINR
jgi:nucleoside-diphosphate-sugar epimerase